MEHTPSTGRPGVETIYQKKTQLEHILLRPDTYIGSTEEETEFCWVLDNETKRLVWRKATIVPGLYKIFDEILVNAADNKQRDSSMSVLKVVIDREKGFISVMNNGKGIPVQLHTEHNMYVPELIFGNLLTSSNYNDAQQKTTGGRNGFGAKLANIFSTKFVVETQDSNAGKHYTQTFRANMSEKSTPTITASTKSDWTKITFYPDFAKFAMDGFDDDIVALFGKRVYDIAGTSTKLKVSLNGERVKVGDFKTYVGLYFPADAPVPAMHLKINDRWEVCVSMSDGHFQQASFVNSICTTKGGKHVAAIADQVTKALAEHINKKTKGLHLKAHHIKNHLSIFVNALIVNPSFDSQTKDTLTTKRANFGSACDLPDDFLKKVVRAGIVENVLAWAKFRQTKELQKNDGRKKTRIHGIPKLDDANRAGGRHAADCTLILTEGDSAKALAVSGLSVVGRDNYGVFPLKGKLLNVREASHASIMGNAEITQLKQIIGLQQGKTYESAASLRYGHVMFMTDQDHDGSHIKGLLINLFATFWPTLLKLPGFLTEFITPIVKVTNGGRSQSFYTMPEYETWKGGNNEGRGWTVKYYKGLGTSTAREAKEYFSNLDRHKIDFRYEGARDDEAIDKAFNKKKADARKQWLAEMVPGTYLDQAGQSSIVYNEFIDKELILFSMASNVRAIPSLVDGLKPGQRKILFSCFKRKLVKEIKVAQLAGYVSEHSAYHHGEVSLTATIVNLAQNFVGSNNINLLMPNGQFGTRQQGGKDSASPRYIFTNLSQITRYIFPAVDDALVEQLTDDGLLIEPEFYCPVIPMVLTNGSAGIGTGWSSNVPNYNPRDLVENLLRMIDGKEPVEMVPWYKGFTGDIVKAGSDRFACEGTVHKVDAVTFRISELPVGTWTTDYKVFLESLREKGLLKDCRDYSTDNDPCFVVTFPSKEAADTVEAEGFHTVFKLAGSLATSNMVLFDSRGRLKKYATAEQIMQEYFDVRLGKYRERKEFLTDHLTNESVKLAEKARFILGVAADTIKIRNVPKCALTKQLAQLDFRPVPANRGRCTTEAESEDSRAAYKDYDYLLSMPLWSLTKEKVEDLQRQQAAKETELREVLATEPADFWRRDLEQLLQKLSEHERAEDDDRRASKPKKKPRVTKTVGPPPTTGTRVAVRRDTAAGKKNPPKRVAALLADSVRQPRKRVKRDDTLMTQESGLSDLGDCEPVR